MRDNERRRGGVFPELRVHLREPAVELVEGLRELAPLGLRELERLTVAVGDLDVLDTLAHEQVLELGLLLDVELAVSDLDEVERRHGDVDVPALDELGHLSVEEGENQRADMRAVDIGVRHDYDAVIPELREVDLVADARPDRRD